MSETIADGSGSGKLAKVNSNQRLYTNSVIFTEDQQATKLGNSYNLSTGVITLTDAVDTPIFYLKNNEDTILEITSFEVGVGPTTGGSGGIFQISVIRNPTEGTIVSSPVDIDIICNRNYGSNNFPALDLYKGATNKTMTDGLTHMVYFQPNSDRFFISVSEMIPKGGSLGIKVQPQTSNTSQDVYATLLCHLENAGE